MQAAQQQQQFQGAAKRTMPPTQQQQQQQPFNAPTTATTKPRDTMHNYAAAPPKPSSQPPKPTSDVTQPANGQRARAGGFVLQDDIIFIPIPRYSMTGNTSNNTSAPRANSSGTFTSARQPHTNTTQSFHHRTNGDSSRSQGSLERARTTPKTPMSKHVERHIQDQWRSLSSVSLAQGGQRANSSLPNVQSFKTAQQYPMTPKLSTDALEAVNLLPLNKTLPRAYLPTTSLPGFANSSSRPANIPHSSGSSNQPNGRDNSHHIATSAPKSMNLPMSTNQPQATQKESSDKGSKSDISEANPIASLANQLRDTKESKSTDGSQGTHSGDNMLKDTSKRTPIIVVETLAPKKAPTVMLPPSSHVVKTPTTNATNGINNGSINGAAPALKTTIVPEGHVVRTKSRPKKKTINHSPTPTPQPKVSSAGKKQTGIWHHGYYDTRGSPTTTPFTWETYLEILPAKVAPKEAFRQPQKYPQNLFTLNMKLEARDPRNNAWSLASVVGIEGLHIRLRLEGTDAMNDLYELVDSDNIRPIGSAPGELLLAPTGFTGNIANYPKFVEKTLKNAIIAGPECFPPTPAKPGKNLFTPGMKLEAVDRKNRDLICPATIGSVDGDKVKIVFDGWRGSFDYICEYDSRDLFPINWCRDVGRPVQQPADWVKLLSCLADKSTVDQSQTLASSSSKSSANSETKDTSPSHDSNSSKDATHRSTSAHVNTSAGSKRARGRAKKKSPDLEGSVSAMQANADSRNNLSSTPKRDIPRPDSILDNLEHSIVPVSDNSASHMVDNDEPSELSNLVTIEGYQCQRTIPYPQCLKKQSPNQMPQNTTTADNSNHVTANCSSSNSSENLTATTQSTNSLNSESRGSNRLDGQQQIKRLKTEPIKPKSKDPSAWNIDEVLDLIGTDETLVKYMDVFREHEIDGKAFMLLTTDILVNHMGMKIGPVLKINGLLEQVKREYNI